MRTKTNKKTGGQILVECLIKHSTDRVFCVPGESYLGALDAFYDFRKNDQQLIDEILNSNIGSNCISLNNLKSIFEKK